MIDINWANWYDKRDSKRNIVIGGIPSGRGSTLRFLEKKETQAINTSIVTEGLFCCTCAFFQMRCPFCMQRDTVLYGSLFRLLSSKKR